MTDASESGLHFFGDGVRVTKAYRVALHVMTLPKHDTYPDGADHIRLMVRFP